MAKFHGKIGYVETKETVPGVYESEFIEKDCTGDIIRNVKSWERSQQLNDNLTISNRFSIVADTYANNNIPNLRYVLWNGVRWKITSVEVQRPRLILTVGGVFNG